MNSRERALLAAPALARADWLPEGEWPELDALREEHRRLLAARVEVMEEATDVRRRHEAEDRERDEALREGYASGDEFEEPEVTPDEERREELAPLIARVTALNEALVAFYVRTEDTIAARFDEWWADLDRKDAEAEADVELARRALEEAEQRLGARQGLRLWLFRTAGRHPRFGALPGRHLPHTHLTMEEVA